MILINTLQWMLYRPIIIGYLALAFCFSLVPSGSMSPHERPVGKTTNKQTSKWQTNKQTGRQTVLDVKFEVSKLAYLIVYVATHLKAFSVLQCVQTDESTRIIGHELLLLFIFIQYPYLFTAVYSTLITFYEIIVFRDTRKLLIEGVLVKHCWLVW